MIESCCSIESELDSILAKFSFISFFRSNNYCRKLSIMFFMMFPASLTFLSLDFLLIEMADSNSALILKSVVLFKSVVQFNQYYQTESSEN